MQHVFLVSLGARWQRATHVFSLFLSAKKSVGERAKRGTGGTPRGTPRYTDRFYWVTNTTRNSTRRTRSLSSLPAKLEITRHQQQRRRRAPSKPAPLSPRGRNTRAKRRINREKKQKETKGGCRVRIPRARRENWPRKRPKSVYCVYLPRDKLGRKKEKKKAIKEAGNTILTRPAS